jgi:hypothetical protein
LSSFAFWYSKYKAKVMPIIISIVIVINLVMSYKL